MKTQLPPTQDTVGPCQLMIYRYATLSFFLYPSISWVDNVYLLSSGSYTVKGGQIQMRFSEGSTSRISLSRSWTAGPRPRQPASQCSIRPFSFPFLTKKSCRCWALYKGFDPAPPPLPGLRFSPWPLNLKPLLCPQSFYQTR